MEARMARAKAEQEKKAKGEPNPTLVFDSQPKDRLR
jgi:hypothetical protein